MVVVVMVAVVKGGTAATAAKLLRRLEIWRGGFFDENFNCRTAGAWGHCLKPMLVR